MKKKSISLSFQLPLIFVVSYIVLGILISIVVYYRFERRMINEYSRMAEGVTGLMAEAIDTDKIDYYVENNYSSEEYNDILKYYYRLKDSYPDIYYMYCIPFLKSLFRPAESLSIWMKNIQTRRLRTVLTGLVIIISSMNLLRQRSVK